MVSEDSVRNRRWESKRQGGRGNGRRGAEDYSERRELVPKRPGWSGWCGRRWCGRRRCASRRRNGHHDGSRIPEPVHCHKCIVDEARTARGGTQVQIPIQLMRSAFFAGHNRVISGHDRQPRVISPTPPERTGGTINTYKVEIQEAATTTDPVIRFDRSETEIEYYVYPANSAAWPADHRFARGFLGETRRHPLRR